MFQKDLISDSYYITEGLFLQKKNHFSLLISLLTKQTLHSRLMFQLILTLFYIYFLLLLAVLHRSTFSFGVWSYFLILRLNAIILKLNFVRYYFIRCFFGDSSRVFIFFSTNFRYNDQSHSTVFYWYWK